MIDPLFAKKAFDADVARRVLEHVDDGEFLCARTMLAGPETCGGERTLWWWQLTWHHPLFGQIFRQHLSDVLEASGLAGSMVLKLLEKRIEYGRQNVDAADTLHLIYLPWVALGAPGFVEHCAEMCTTADASNTVFVVEVITNKEIESSLKRLYLLELYGFRLGAITRFDDGMAVNTTLRYFSVVASGGKELVYELSNGVQQYFSKLEIEDLIRTGTSSQITESKVDAVCW